MNYNANANARQPGPGRKIKRVSDVNAVGPTITPQSNAFMPMTSGYQPPVSAPMAPPIYGAPTAGPGGMNQQQGYGGYNQSGFVPPNQPSNEFGAYVGGIPGGYPQGNVPIGGNVGGPLPPNSMPQSNVPGGMFGGPGAPQLPAQFAMFQQPIVQDMAMQYGQKLADQGKELVNEKFEKYIPVTRLKYYFAVDNKYVIHKLRLLFFPFTHKDWSLKYDQDSPVQPRHDVNAPDLYIPTMAYITYVALAGFVLAMQNRFSPEQLGIHASSALAYIIFELLVYSITLYVANIPSTLKTLDLLAYSGYKYAIMVGCILIMIVSGKMGYYISLICSGLSLAFFLLRTLKAKVLVQSDSSSGGGAPTYDPYGQQQQPQYDRTLGKKRKLYFLFLVAGFQPLLSFWLTFHLIPSPSTT